MAATATEVQMKLLVDSNSKKVLFAEVGKDCVDFLFHLLSLPLGTVIRLLNEQGMVGCIANLYDSVENLNETYLQNKQTKDMVLKPKLPVSFGSIPLLSLPSAPNVRKTFYCCASRSNYSSFGGGYVGNEACGGCVSDSTGALCNNCRNEMKSIMTYVSPPENKVSGVNEGGGIVKGVVTYMVMDNLVVKPMSTISSIAILNQLNVKEVGALQEKTVTLTMDKALKLLRLSFKSDAVLTNVFLQ